MDSYLTTAKAGLFWLEDQRIASAVVESLQYGEATVYDLEAYCIMPNHVHLVCTPRLGQDGEYQSISSIMHSIKRQSANRANRLLDRQGAFWQHESYDRVFRDENEMRRVIRYVVMNPVSAGLVQNWEDWRWTFLADRWKELGFG
jgi:REP element-mobilizing transposase RayT